MLKKLRRLLSRKGTLSTEIIAQAKGVFHPATYRKRFGSLHRAFQLIGYQPSPRHKKSAEHFARTTRLRKSLLADLKSIFSRELEIVRIPSHHWELIQFSNGLRLSVYLCRKFLTLNRKEPRWLLHVRPSERQYPVLICLVDDTQSSFSGLYVLPAIEQTIGKWKILRKDHPWLSKGRKLATLHQFCDAAQQIVG